MPKRLLTVVVPVCTLGLATVLAAAVAFALEPHDATTLLGVAALLAASTLANRFPVPVEGVDSGGVSLSFVFGASALVLFGWEAGVLVAFAAPAIMQLLEHRPLIRIAYNVVLVRPGRGGRGAVRRAHRRVRAPAPWSARSRSRPAPSTPSTWP